MPVEIRITGECASDVALEVKVLADELGKKEAITDVTIMETVESGYGASLPTPPPPPAAVVAPLPTADVAASAAVAPPPTPVAVAPPPQTAAAIAPINQPLPVEVDARGYVWDARIHNKAKTKKKDDNWKNQRGLDPALIVQVEAELAAAAVTPAAPADERPPLPAALDRSAIATAAAVPVIPTAAPAPVAVPTAAPAPVAVPTAAPAPVAAPVAAPDAPSAAALYPMVATKMSNAITSQYISPQRCAELLAVHGVNAIPELVDNVEALTLLNGHLDAEIAAATGAA